MECLVWLAGGRDSGRRHGQELHFSDSPAPTKTVTSEKHNLKENTYNKICDAIPKITFS